MVAAQALALEQFLAGQGFVRKPGGLNLLSGAGAKLARASDLPSLASRRELLATSAPALDRLLEGGLPRGALVELSAGARSCGRFAAGLSALAAATSSGLACALIDMGGHLDPRGAEEAGVDLALLLWARPRRIRQALAAAETLLCAGFPLVVFDLGLSRRGLRFVPDAAWVRLARAAQAQSAALLVLSPVRSSGVAAQSAISAGAARPLWIGRGREPRLLTGLSSRLTLDKELRARTGLSETLSLLCHPEPLTLPCHPERSEGSTPVVAKSTGQILRRSAPQDDRVMALADADPPRLPPRPPLPAGRAAAQRARAQGRSRCHLRR